MTCCRPAWRGSHASRCRALTVRGQLHPAGTGWGTEGPCTALKETRTTAKEAQVQGLVGRTLLACSRRKEDSGQQCSLGLGELGVGAPEPYRDLPSWLGYQVMTRVMGRPLPATCNRGHSQRGLVKTHHSWRGLGKTQGHAWFSDPGRGGSRLAVRDLWCRLSRGSAGLPGPLLATSPPSQLLPSPPLGTAAFPVLHQWAARALPLGCPGRGPSTWPAMNLGQAVP